MCSTGRRTERHRLEFLDEVDSEPCLGRREERETGPLVVVVWLRVGAMLERVRFNFAIRQVLEAVTRPGLRFRLVLVAWIIDVAIE